MRYGNWCIKKLVLGVGLSTFFAGTVSAAEIPTTTTYELNSSSARAETQVDTGLKTKVDGFLSEVLVKSWKKLHWIADAGVTGTGKTKDKMSDYLDYITHNREAHARVKLNIPSKPTLLFKVEEYYRTCKSGESCSLRARTTIKGPIHVYGTTATDPSAIDLTQILEGKQKIGWKLTQDSVSSGSSSSSCSHPAGGCSSNSSSSSSDSGEAEITATFTMTSVSYEQQLFDFLDALNMTLQVNDQDINSNELKVTRKQVLLSVARMLRKQNERIVEL